MPGVTPEVLARTRERIAAAAPPAPDRAWFDVWDENWETYLFFASLETQWAKLVIPCTHTTPAGPVTVSEIRRECLPANRVESAARMRGVPRAQWPQLLADIQAMEHAVLERDAELRLQASE